jgi:hypothetical protein
MDFLTNVVANIIANVVFWLGLGGAVWILARNTRKSFLSFFGLTETHALKAYISNVRPSETENRRLLVSGHEFRITRSLATLFGTAPGRYPDLVRGLVDGIFVGTRIRFDVDICPDTPERADDSAIIIVGGALRNTLRQYYVNTHQTLTLSSGEELGADRHPRPIMDHSYWRITRGPRVNENIGQGANTAVVERFIDPERGRVVICCAGIRGDGSWASVEYLVRHWRDLHRRFGQQPFAMVLEFPTGHPDPYLNEYVEPRVLAVATG